MRHQLFIFCVIGILSTQVASGQDNKVTEVQYSPDTIAFNLTSHNNIVIQAILNDVDTLDLMFHTAANDVSLIKESTDKITSMVWNDEVGDVNSWGGKGEQRMSENNILKIGEFQWDSLLIWESQHSGPTTDGKFGPNLFVDKWIELNYDSSFVAIHRFKPFNTGDYERLALHNEHGNMFIEGKSKIGNKEISNRYLIHSGYSGAILYDDEFAEANNLSGQIEITEEQDLKDSLGYTLTTKKGKIPQFSLGNQVLDDITVGFFSGAIGRQKMSVLGGNVLKRFNILIDSEREHIYLKSNGLVD